MLELLITIAVILMAGWLIYKKVDIRVVMFGTGFLLLIAAMVLQRFVIADGGSSGWPLFDLFRVVERLFTTQLQGPGFIVMLLFGYTAYMTKIGASTKAVQVLSVPLKRIRHRSLLIPLFFLIGNFLCVVIPSASSLAILLMSTAYPILVGAGVSPLGVGAVIATSATIAPTPLGIDNVLAAEALSMSLSEYVFGYHARISIPIILVMAVVHYGWQRFCDKMDGMLHVEMEAGEDLSEQLPFIYALLPMLPLVLVMGFTLFFEESGIGIVEVTLLSLVVSVSCECIRCRSYARCEKVKEFFEGMGVGLSTVVVQVVAALTFVEGLRSLGIIEQMSQFMKNTTGSGLLIIVVFCLLALGIGLLSGSGLALFYAFIELIPDFAIAAGMNPMVLGIPMHFTAHLVKSISPVAPTIIITSSMMKVSSMALIKRTVVPIAVGMALSVLLPYVMFY